MMKAKLTRSCNGIVLASVIYYKILYCIYTVNMLRKVVIRKFKCFLLVIAWYLNDKLHIYIPFYQFAGEKRIDCNAIPS